MVTSLATANSTAAAPSTSTPSPIPTLHPSPSRSRTITSSPPPSALRQNLGYLISADVALRPSSLRTRAMLNTLRYVSKFIFYRLLRYFKYAAIAAGTTALAGTFLGSTLPFLAAIAVPSIPVAAAIGLTTAAIKFSWKHRGNHFRQGWAMSGEGRDARIDESRSAGTEM